VGAKDEPEEYGSELNMRCELFLFSR
jgi:hypothetical protein